MDLSIPWGGLLELCHLDLFEGLSGIVGHRTMQKVLALYEEARLVERGGGEWMIWGDKNTSGTSRGPIPHSAVVAAVGYCLQKKLGLGNADLIVTADLVHDAFKRQDMELKDYGVSHTKSRARIEELFGSGVADLAELSGHGAMPTALLNLGDLLTSTVFLVDNLVVGTRIVSAAEKCDMLDAAFMAGRYPYNNDGVATYGVPFFTFQRYLSVVLEAQVAQRLRVEPTAALATQVKVWVKEEFGVAV